MVCIDKELFVNDSTVSAVKSHSTTHKGFNLPLMRGRSATLLVLVYFSRWFVNSSRWSEIRAV